MATKKQRQAELCAQAGATVEITAEQGKVVDNLDEIIEAAQKVLARCRKTDYLAAEPKLAIDDRDMLRALKDQANDRIKSAKSYYDMPFSVIDAKAKALCASIDHTGAIVEAVAEVHEAAAKAPERAEIMTYFDEQARWLGPTYGPIIWAKHPAKWDNPKSMEKVRSEIDSLLLVVRSAFRIIHGWASPFERMLLERYCELSNLNGALGEVYSLKRYLDRVAEVALSGGDRWDGWSDDVLFFDEDVVSETILVRGSKSRVEAARAAIAAMGLSVETAEVDAFEEMARWMEKEGFAQPLIDEALADARALGYGLSQVKALSLTPEMTKEEIESAFFRGLLDDE